MNYEIEKGLREVLFSLRAANDEERTLTFRGTTESVARDGGILLADGMNAQSFDANPVVLWAHDMDGGQVNVIGKVTNRIFDEEAKAWDFSVKFATAEQNPLADTVYRLAKDEFVRAASVGFMVSEFERDIDDERREEMGLGKTGWIAKEWELYELSLVPVGSDPAALKRAGVATADIELLTRQTEDAEEIEEETPEAEEEQPEETEVDTAEEQRTLADTFCRSACDLVDAMDLLTRTMGELRQTIIDGDSEPVTESTAAADVADDKDDDDTARKLEEIMYKLKEVVR